MEKEIKMAIDTKKIQLSGCVIIRNEKILVLWKKKHNHYELPGGKVEQGETLEQAALREIKEEIDCDVSLIKYIGCKEFHINSKDYQSHNFLAEIPDEQKPRIAEIDVFDHVFWMPIKEYRKYDVAENVKELCEDYIGGKLDL